MLTTRVKRKKGTVIMSQNNSNNSNKTTSPTSESSTNILTLASDDATADYVDDPIELLVDGSVTHPPPKKRRLLDFDYTQVRNENWEKKFGWLVDYKKAHDGSTLVPHIYDKNLDLGSWVSIQRVAYKEKKLSTERITRLNRIGFVWKVRTQVPWIDSYHRLVAYKEKYGTTVVQKRDHKDPWLGRWVSRQRHRCKKEDRIQLLNAIGFVWDARIDRG